MTFFREDLVSLDQSDQLELQGTQAYQDLRERKAGQVQEESR